MISKSLLNHCLKFNIKKIINIDPIIIPMLLGSNFFTGSPIGTPSSEIRYFFCPKINATSQINIPIPAHKKPHLKSIEPQTRGEKNAPKLIPM